ncbi:hypothetical protein H4582DRAFT_1547574 [Lactarius indigo]|nr:hypothetical protein H4582DRAFT_1547574 [Lactarius indigo]
MPDAVLALRLMIDEQLTPESMVCKFLATSFPGQLHGPLGILPFAWQMVWLETKTTESSEGGRLQLTYSDQPSSNALYSRSHVSTPICCRWGSSLYQHVPPCLHPFFCSSGCLPLTQWHSIKGRRSIIGPLFSVWVRNWPSPRLRHCIISFRFPRSNHSLDEDPQAHCMVVSSNCRLACAGL